ncbi:MAG: GNAT family N-acetyltransferase [Phycisphaerales bacterium]|nr:GNAT family N-acetyltransferase [Phycisphaerales bacterium]
MTHLMLSNCSIAPVTTDDLEDIYRLIGDIYREYGMTLVLADEAEQHLADPGAYFRKNGGEFWVVRDARDGRLIATAAVHLHEEDQNTAELKSLYVHRDHRRGGFGRALTTLAMRYARSRGRRRFVLWSDTRLTAAHAMYESMGFVRCGERDIVDSNNSHEYGFEIALSD